MPSRTGNHAAMDPAGSAPTVPAAGRRSSNQDTRNVQGACRPFDADDVNFHWISITNIHPFAASPELVWGFLPHCVRIGRAISEDIVFEVAFESREAAEEAINLYQNNIRMFQQTWRFQHCGHTRFSEQESLGSQGAHELCNGGRGEGQDIFIGQGHSTALNGLVIIDRGFGNECLLLHIDGTTAEQGILIGPGCPALIALFVDQRVPIEIIWPLFGTVGRVRCFHTVPQTLVGSFAVIVFYEYREDAISAFQRFDRQIMIFGSRWVMASVSLLS